MKYKVLKLSNEKYAIEVLTEEFGWIILFDDEGLDMREFKTKEVAEEWVKTKNYNEVIFI